MKTELSADNQLVVATPDIVLHTVVPGEDEFLLLACDGIWDVMTNTEVVDFVRTELRLANKQCLRALAENFGTLRVDVIKSKDVSKYSVGQYCDFPRSRDQLKGYIMKVISQDGSGAGPGELHLRRTPPEAWEGGWSADLDKAKVAKAWPCGIVCEKLIDQCLERGSGDNLSATLVLLSDDIGMAGHDGSTLDSMELGRGMDDREMWRRDKTR